MAVKGKKVIAVLPAYNAQATLGKTIDAIPKEVVDEIILVDDNSTDGTAALSRKLGLVTIVHDKNRGYGGNQKSCYTEALARGADIVIMIHPDYQYDPRLTPYLAGIIADDVCDMVCGNRIRTRREALGGGMPKWKYFANRLMSIVENVWSGQNLGEWHSGMRAYSKELLEVVPWQENSEDFVFDQQFLHQVALMGFRLGDIPVSARYFEEASSINLRRSLVYGFETLGVMFWVLLARLGLYLHPMFRPRRERTPS
ncbi:MAG: glycosyl transferase family 2 [Elusimicrobia bacterium CG1_02_63_36]|nr:MAG: glycosyl transferase family 2 [Elusimicrobia bacterium CG1_02_63_36]PIP82296.1 MAG: glycosyl transferase family 2 [Elusimicrobia bacterium CG22_combo_CG10-13_8_21_14_all_63_91]PJA15287.1 MAG: glycosyl transferase family 2 [Elusimicrobia bacterium CG_4_10_14_0_2_um_filter_63_34]PJB27029.1 MAG: glycosyl transferase family 2 [Elusimicrobia bacterium CG_4_9_14_3_um_filter_62_55]